MFVLTGDVNLPTNQPTLLWAFPFSYCCETEPLVCCGSDALPSIDSFKALKKKDHPLACLLIIQTNYKTRRRHYSMMIQLVKIISILFFEIYSLACNRFNEICPFILCNLY